MNSITWLRITTGLQKEPGQKKKTTKKTSKGGKK